MEYVWERTNRVLANEELLPGGRRMHRTRVYCGTGRVPNDTESDQRMAAASKLPGSARAASQSRDALREVSGASVGVSPPNSPLTKSALDTSGLV